MIGTITDHLGLLRAYEGLLAIGECLALLGAHSLQGDPIEPKLSQLLKLSKPPGGVASARRRTPAAAALMANDEFHEAYGIADCSFKLNKSRWTLFLLGLSAKHEDAGSLRRTGTACNGCCNFWEAGMAAVAFAWTPSKRRWQGL